MSEQMESRVSSADVHRDLGRIEGRVLSLENAMSKLEAFLPSILNKLDEIQTHSGLKLGELQEHLLRHIAEEDGRRGSDKSRIHMAQFSLNLVVAVATAYILMYH